MVRADSNVSHYSNAPFWFVFSLVISQEGGQCPQLSYRPSFQAIKLAVPEGKGAGETKCRLLSVAGNCNETLALHLVRPDLLCLSY